jgi:FMN phosphatase YigB (HAD superfamily)
MGIIKLALWDIYGTVIVYKDKLRLRPGALESLVEIKSREVNQCTISDAQLSDVKGNLREVGINWQDFFVDLYKMEPNQQKDCLYIAGEFNLDPENLLVIGNDYYADIELAKKQGCHTLHFPEHELLDIQKIQKLLSI